LIAPAALANSDPYTDTLPAGGAAIGYLWQAERSPYRGAQNGHSLDPFYLYEGDYAYLHFSRAGLKLEQDAWRFDAFVAQRFEGYTVDRVPAAAVGMETREQGFDLGASLRRRTAWGTPYLELLHDASHHSGGSELRLGYWNEWVRGRLQLRPHAVLAWRDSKLNDYYYGVRAAEADSLRPAYSAGAGSDAELALYATYRMFGNWHLFGSVGATRRSAAVAGSPLVENRTSTTAMLGVMYDFSPAIKRWAPEAKPLIARLLYGASSNCDVLQIVRLACTSTHTADSTDIWGMEVGRTLIRQPNGHPVEIAGFLGLIRHVERGHQADFWQYNAYFKAYYYGFPWDSRVRTRLGWATGLSYVERVPEMERRDQARSGQGSWKLLNALNPSIDVRVGDLVRSPRLRDTYVGIGVSHRSGMFGRSRLLGNVDGGSNYIYVSLETTF